MNHNVSIPLSLEYHYDNRGGWWIGKCNEFDILTSHPSLQQVKKDLKTICDAQVKYAVENGLLHTLFRKWG